jgi:hypothetical protein
MQNQLAFHPHLSYIDANQVSRIRIFASEAEFFRTIRTAKTLT